ncbi:hypothetical protein [Segatella paludivivens]|uniref:hypothetical protein n=1 Tax=Segatella paludivivens TaxID=185294 RepID=UPI00035FC539|nr:hypothetical protein [Segatella paludivivens]
MDYNTIDWVFSTLPQILAAFVGLLVTGVIFIYSKIGNDTYPEDTWYGIIEPFQASIWKKLKIVLITTFILLTIDLIVLTNDKTIANEPYYKLVIYLMAICNFIPIIKIFQLVLEIMNPNKFDNIIHNIAKETQNEGIDFISPTEFLNHMIDLERNIRKKYTNVEKHTNILSIRIIMQYYFETGVINKDEFDSFLHALQLRNIIVHGGEVNDVNKNIDESIKMINRKFLSLH